MRYWLVMPAAGCGLRFGTPTPKQYAALCGRTVIEWSLAPFLRDARCAGIAVALAASDSCWPQVTARLPAVSTVTGGEHRSQSVRAALAALAARAAAMDWVLVHDAARPCLAEAELDRLLSLLHEHPVGGLLAVAVTDTLKREAASSSRAPLVASTAQRGGLWRALTPQMFRYGALCAALDAAHAEGRYPTDEAQALEWRGEQPALVAASETNLKVTTAQDLALAQAVLQARGGRGAMRTGSGIDVHAFGPGDSVMLGGVRVPHSHGVVAHSDGDVILHALCDALLGAAALGDIGEHFSDRDPQWRGADSARFVIAVMDMLRERRLAVVNADVTVLAQLPRLAPHRAAMRTRIAGLLGVEEDAVNLKATTTEGLGFLGRGEGVAAQAVVLLREL
ncbi:MAG: 2-C-methyl-D-erythritol 4-phosphate cytidylyltransferase [Proteobacteria bacterium]|nr:2-C-methyl-D-erythritol 4-phosphate cytidylyltransferase [Pseudomonadota bacterium]